jgi:hypothetical protein
MDSGFWALGRMDTTPDIEVIYDIIQDEFDSLDKQVGDFGKRRMAITQLPQLARDLLPSSRHRGDDL